MRGEFHVILRGHQFDSTAVRVPRFSSYMGLRPTFILANLFQLMYHQHIFLEMSAFHKITSQSIKDILSIRVFICTSNLWRIDNELYTEWYLHCSDADNKILWQTSSANRESRKVVIYEGGADPIILHLKEQQWYWITGILWCGWDQIGFPWRGPEEHLRIWRTTVKMDWLNARMGYGFRDVHNFG